jgi:hypothetical protein
LLWDIWTDDFKDIAQIAIMPILITLIFHFAQKMKSLSKTIAATFTIFIIISLISYLFEGNLRGTWGVHVFTSQITLLFIPYYDLEYPSSTLICYSSFMVLIHLSISILISNYFTQLLKSVAPNNSLKN